MDYLVSLYALHLAATRGLRLGGAVRECIARGRGACIVPVRDQYRARRIRASIRQSALRPGGQNPAAQRARQPTLAQGRRAAGPGAKDRGTTRRQDRLWSIADRRDPHHRQLPGRVDYRRVLAATPRKPRTLAGAEYLDHRASRGASRTRSRADRGRLSTPRHRGAVLGGGRARGVLFARLPARQQGSSLIGRARAATLDLARTWLGHTRDLRPCDAPP